jgi:hypothetical protein
MYKMKLHEREVYHTSYCYWCMVFLLLWQGRHRVRPNDFAIYASAFVGYFLGHGVF